MLSELVYVSARKDNCTEGEIQKILEACKRNNNDIDVTGVLLYSDSHFIQYLEGEYKKIMNLYDTIKDDDRHKNVVLINTKPIDERTFPSWQMGSKKINEDKISFKTDMDPSDAQEFDKILSGEESNNASDIIKKFFK